MSTHVTAMTAAMSSIATITNMHTIQQHVPNSNNY